ncbi:uncharacterized protein V6R79_015409 [Siganus canaliculatus]
MLRGCLRCLTCFFTYASVLRLGLCLAGLEAVKDEDVLHKLVGQDVTLPSGLKDENVSNPQWDYNGSIIADKDGSAKSQQFDNRLTLNPRDFNLTVRRLTLKDSGRYSFVSEDQNGNQRGTIQITLEVHEPITKEPTITSTSAWHGSNQSCTINLVCHAADDSSLRYKWTVRNETRSGSTLQYAVRPQDGETKFTCTVFNTGSEKSTIKMLKCSNETQEEEEGRLDFIIVVSAAGGGILLLVVVVGIIAWRCRHSKSGSDTNELTVYADITEVSDPSMMKPCSVYETIDHRESRVAPKPQTVYDQIQFSRVAKA